MLCDDCRKMPARVHITKIMNNQKIDMNLCEECAKKQGELIFSSAEKFSVHDFLKGMFSHTLTDSPQPKETACPKCSMTYNDFSRSGKIGCAECYQTFSRRLQPLLRRIHGANSHTGKIPKRSGGMIELKRRVENMRRQLEQYVAKEEYEQAALLRDEIRRAEREMNGRE